jgi:hypothetical protein
LNFLRSVTFADNLGLDELQALQSLVLLMWAVRSPESALSVARAVRVVRVVRVVRQTLRQVTPVPQPGLGHTGPITHAGRINAQIAEFIEGS